MGHVRIYSCYLGLARLVCSRILLLYSISSVIGTPTASSGLFVAIIEGYTGHMVLSMHICTCIQSSLRSL